MKDRDFTKHQKKESINLELLWLRNTIDVLDRQPTKGSTRSRCGLAEIGNSKEETRGTQFRQVRAVRCVIPYVLYAT
jgi:hypothetical protein